MAEKEKTFNEAKQLYMEQYGSALVEKTYLKIALVLVSIIAVLLIFLNIKTQKMVQNFKPLVIRINDVGRAEVVKYDNFKYKPQEKELKYFFSQFIKNYYGMQKATIQDAFANAVQYLTPDLAKMVLKDYQKNKTIEKFLADNNAPEKIVNIDNIVFLNLKKEPFKVMVDFTAVWKSRISGKVIDEKKYTSQITFRFKKDITNKEILVNPLGIEILDIQTDEAF